MKLLLHACCAPCANAPYHHLAEQGIDTGIFWYNPNIHPYQEYKSRKTSLQGFCTEENIPLILEDDYGLRPFVQAVAENISARCSHCYEIRLFRTAEVAKEQGYDGFSSSLLISPYQNHELLREMGERAGNAFDIPFHYEDFRPLFRQGQNNAREKLWYMQKYCGCVFSEEDRYLAPKKKAKSKQTQT